MIKRGMGWLPDYPDFRDYTEETEEIKTILQSSRSAKSGKTSAKNKKRSAITASKLPASVDLRPWSCLLYTSPSPRDS